MTAQHKKILLLLIIYIGFISLGLPDTILGVAWHKIRIDMAQPVAYAGIITFLLYSCSTVSSLYSGQILRRLGTGKLLFICGLMTGLALLGYGCAGAFWILLLMTIPLGFGQGAIDTGMNYYVAKHYTSRDMSWLHCCWGIGASAGPGLMTLMLSQGFSWRPGYWIVAAIQILLALMFMLTLPLWQENRENGESKKEEFPADQTVIKDYRFWCCPAMFFLYTSIEVGMGLWGYMYLTTCRGVDETLAGYAVTGYWGMLTLGRFVLGFLANRMGNIRQLRFSMGGAIFCGILMLVPQTEISLTGFILCGFMLASVYPSMMHIAPERFNEATAATVIGFQGGGATLGVAICPVLLGIAATYSSFMVLPILLLLTAVAMLYLEILVDGLHGEKNRVGVQGMD